MKKEDYGFVFYIDTDANDWYGIMNVSITQVDEQTLKDAYYEVVEEINRRKLSQTPSEKLRVAINLLKEVSEDWDTSKVKHYPQKLGSFDEVVLELSRIRLEEEK